MRKILASDYDGTLNRGGISGQTVEMIRKWQSQGNLFGIVTGRDFVRSFPVFTKENAFPFDFIICHNGTVGVDAKGNVLFADSADGKMKWGKTTLAQELVRRCLELTGNPCGISFETTRLDFHPNSLKGLEAESGDGTEYSPLSALAGVGVFNLANAFCGTDEQAAAVTETLKSEFGEALNPLQNGWCIDISPVGVDKCTGIRRYAELMGVAHEDIWTAGDNYNDISMLKAYHGCAMEGSPKPVVEAGEYVCDGIAEAIKLVLEQEK